MKRTIKPLESNKDLVSTGERKGYLAIKDGRVTYANRKSYNFKDPEEKIRANAYVELIENYKYPISKIDTEVLGPRREPKLPADIVIYEDNNKENAFIVVETKAASSRKDIEEAKREGLGNANLLNAKYLLIVAGSERLAYNIDAHPSTVSALEKYRLADIPVKYGNAPKYRYTKGAKKNDLKRARFNELDSKFQLCHEEIWEGGRRDPAVAFDEISKLIITKLYDEQYTLHGRPYNFQIGTFEQPQDVAVRVKEVYDTVQKKNSDVFQVKIDLPDDILFRIVEHLQDISLRTTDLDAKGRAFENFLGKLFRGEYGQYFTARQIVEFMVGVSNLNEHDYLIDPACGSGGFLLYSIKHVLNEVSEKYKEDKETTTRLGWDFAHKQIFGIEINDRIARVAMMDMVIHEDGHSNIECNDALEDYEKFDPQKAINPDKYDILLTNPPFGKRIKPNEKTYFGNYTLAQTSAGKLKKSEMSEILFIERCIDLVKEDGFIGIVLPDSAFTNKRNIPIVKYLLDKTQILGVVSIPQHTFIPYGSMSKTSLLFLRKKKSREKIKEYPIFMAHVERVGYDATRRDDRNDLPRILEEWKKFKNDKDKYPKFNQLEDDLWVAKVGFSQVKNKLDVEAYGKVYLETVARIHSSENQATKIAPLSDLCIDIFPGIGPRKSDYKNMGIPVIKTATVSKVTSKIGFVNWATVEYVDRKKYQDSQKFVQKDDILIQSVAHTKEYIADKMAILDYLPRDLGKVLALSKFLILRPDPQKVEPIYLFIYLSSKLGREQFKHFIRGMTAEIYEFDIRNILVALPSSTKQKKIIKKYLENTKRYFQLRNEVTTVKNLLDTLERDLL